MISYKSFIKKLIKAITHCTKTMYGLINTCLNFTCLKLKSSTTLAAVPLLLVILYTLPASIFAQEVKVGIYQNPPKIFTDKQGNPAGLMPDIIDYIAQQEGWDIVYIKGSFADGLRRIREGKIDIMPDVAFSLERAEIYSFNSETVISDWGRFYARRGVDVDNLIDFHGKRIAVMRNGIYNIGARGVRAMTKKFGIDCTIIEMDSYEDIFRVLDEGAADVGVVNRIFGRKHFNDYDIKETTVLISPIEIKFAFSPDNPLTPQLIERVDYHLRQMKNRSDSVYYRSISRHIGGFPGEEQYILPDWAKLSLIIAGVLLILFFIRQAIFKFKINIKIRELEREYLDRRETAGRLSRAESKFNKFFHALPIPAFIIDSNGYFTEINTAFIRETGYDQDEVVGKSIFEPLEMFDAASKDKIMDNFRRRINREEVVPYTIKVKTVSGKVKYLKVSAAAVFKNNNIVEVIGTAVEVPGK